MHFNMFSESEGNLLHELNALHALHALLDHLDLRLRPVEPQPAGQSLPQSAQTHRNLSCYCEDFVMHRHLRND